uniref:CARD domain-containing protein n=1 Tax=Pseudonaja textilis TaxID=8673 RepID=A0A670YIE8_PSETE
MWLKYYHYLFILGGSFDDKLSREEMRETILSSMTDGRLNHLLDVLRAQQLLPKADYEMITSYPTLTLRTRALIDTCLSLGEQAAETVVTVLSNYICQKS